VSVPRPLLVIDAPMLVFQAFFGVQEDLRDPHGRAIHAVLGFTRRLVQLLRARPAMRPLACWDESLGTGFRHRLYPPYKANRPPADEAFLHQISRCMELLQALGIAQTGSSEFEADDLMAAAVVRQRRVGGYSVVVSHDKDLAQVIEGADMLWRHPRSGPADAQSLAGEWGFPVSRIADALALAGDASDNIPGLPGIGITTASAIMAGVDSLETLYAHPGVVHGLRVRGPKKVIATLNAHREDAFLFRSLTRLRTDAIDDSSWATLGDQPAEAAAIGEWLALTGLTERLAALLEPVVSQRSATLLPGAPA
jgi:DNA polymerase-1